MLSTGLSKLAPPPTAAAHDVHRVALVQVQRGGLDIADGAGLDQRNRHALVADRQRGALQGVLEAELEADVLLGVAVVVDMDLVQRVRVEREIVRAAVGVLQRQVVGDQGDVVGPPGLVAHEHIEVTGVDLGDGGNEGSLAVAGGVGGLEQRQQAGGRKRQQPRRLSLGQGMGHERSPGVGRHDADLFRTQAGADPMQAPR